MLEITEKLREQITEAYKNHDHIAVIRLTDILKAILRSEEAFVTHMEKEPA